MKKGRSKIVSSNQLTRLPSTLEHAVAKLVEALRYKPKGRGFDSPDGVIGIFHNPSGRSMMLSQPLTEMGTTDISWGVKAAGA